MAIQQQAAAIGIAPECLAARLIEQRFSQISDLLVVEADWEVARARFERHFGALSLDKATSLDNERLMQT
ncbi:hypothetical protein [Gloeocapsopsis sp. IPPAS B-1203]|uniref:hypothetical protein n=1 Tax=Gloeocapsopsis sp. IPPAS B-1203 TaxID=2049454 RepID=UPI0025A029E8|nr:hypothetical protein [Gloeocapsopsis sp. IPPAS B-1203]